MVKLLVTGAAGHLGEGLVRVARRRGFEALGMDIRPGPFVDIEASICDPKLIGGAMKNVGAVFHAATLHKPHVATNTPQDFIDVNVTGTLNILSAAAEAGAKVVFTSTTSAFGDALTPKPGGPATWIDEGVIGAPKNIYGATKTAAEDLCALFARNHGVDCTVLRTSRFFPEDDDNAAVREGFSSENAKANEFLYRRVDLKDAVEAHFDALSAGLAGFARFVISAPTPFAPGDLARLRSDPNSVIAGYYPDFPMIYENAGFRMFPEIGRVYVSKSAVQSLSWRPKWSFAEILAQIEKGEPIGSDLAREVGVKGYHDQEFEEGPYPVA